MAVRINGDLPTTKPLTSKTKDLTLNTLDILRNLNARYRRYLRDYPNTRRGRLPTPSRDEVVLALVEVGFLQYTGSSFRLSLLGEIAQGEIWQAEQYLTEHFPRVDQKGQESNFFFLSTGSQLRYENSKDT